MPFVVKAGFGRGHVAFAFQPVIGQQGPKALKNFPRSEPCVASTTAAPPAVVILRVAEVVTLSQVAGRLHNTSFTDSLDFPSSVHLIKTTRTAPLMYLVSKRGPFGLLKSGMLSVARRCKYPASDWALTTPSIIAAAVCYY